MNACDVSVLVPLMDDRHTGERCVRAWTQGQTFPRDRYEIIALAPGVDPALESAVRPMLREHDRWLEHKTPMVVELLNEGARQARGRLLFLTESHCEPDPDCLASIVRHLAATGEVGARGATVGRGDGVIGRWEQARFEEGMRRGERERAWDRVLIHSFAIQRDVFLEAGGFASRFGNYCHFALGLALLERGHRLGLAPQSVVYHTYEGKLGELADLLFSFGAGEIEYCATDLTEPRARLLDEVEEWTNRWQFTRSGARRVLAAALAARRINRGVAGELMQHAAVAIGGLDGARAYARANEAIRRLIVKAMPGRGLHRRRALDRWWHMAARIGRLQGLQANPPPKEPPAVQAACQTDVLGLADVRLIGFHQGETWGGRRFRWTSPLAVIQVAPPPGRPVEALLELLPVTPERSISALRVVANGRRIDPRLYRRRGMELRFPVPAKTEWLALVAPGLRAGRSRSAEYRNLGLAVASLRFVPSADGSAGKDCALV